MQPAPLPSSKVHANPPEHVRAKRPREEAAASWERLAPVCKRPRVSAAASVAAALLPPEAIPAPVLAVPCRVRLQAAPWQTEFSGRLDRGLQRPTLYVPNARPQTITLERHDVHGLQDGADVTLVADPEAGAGMFRLQADATMYARSMVGRVVVQGGQVWAEALRPNGPYQRLPLHAYPERQPGEIVVATLDHPDSPKAWVALTLPDVKAAVTHLFAIACDCGVPFGFPSAVLRDAYALIRERPKAPVDYTGLPFFTLDPKYSRVLDQAMHITRTDTGGFLFYYAIADSTAWLPQGSPTDVEACARGSADYIGATIPQPLGPGLPMLPHDLSSYGGSLIFDEPRAALVVCISLDANCQVLGTQFTHGLIKSHAKLSDEQVQRYLDGGKRSYLVSSPCAPALSSLVKLGEGLIRRNQLRGSRRESHDVNHAPSVVATLGGQVRAFANRDTTVSRYNAQLSMLVNEVVAQELARRHVLAPFVQHHRPIEGSRMLRHKLRALGAPWPTDVDLATYLATLDNNHPQIAAIRHLIFTYAPPTTYQTRPDIDDVMKLGAYTRVTAPLRRYPDVVVQRILDACLQGTELPYQDEAVLWAALQGANRHASRERLVVCRQQGVRLAGYLQPHQGSVLAAHAASRVLQGRVQVTLDDSGVRLWASLAEQSLGPGQAVRVRIESVDVAAGSVRACLTSDDLTPPPPST